MTKASDPVEALADMLAEHGPLPEDEIMRWLRDVLPAGADIELDELLDEIGSPIAQLADDRWVWLPAMLAGRVFTHRLSTAELVHDMLAVTPDLDPVTMLCEDERFGRFTDGSAAQIALPAFDGELLERREIPPEAADVLGALLLTPGTLGHLGVSEGDMVGVRLTDSGLTVERAETLVDTEVGARLTAMLGDRAMDLETAIWTLCSEDPAAFTAPGPPLSQVVDDCGLSRRGGLVAPQGFDFDSWLFESGCELLAERHGLDPDDAVALHALIKMYEQFSLLIDAADDGMVPDTPAAGDEDTPSALPDLMGDLGAVLADPLLAALLVSETVGDGPEGAAALGLFAETLEPKVPRPARVACRWLRAVALERIGDIEEAERELLAAESMDTGWAPVLFDLARFASDRGDAERGLSLLRRAGAEADDPLSALLERHLARPRDDLGRNDACWCGSGRKYKKCHLGREQLPLAERAEWLYSKAAQHTLLGGWRDLLDEVGLERSRYAEDDQDVIAALTDPLVIDSVLFEGGAFADFVEARGSLLPDDERLLAEQWLLAERSVFEVEQVHRGRGLTLRDVRTGDTHEVREATASRQLKAGQLICARVVPAGDTMQIFGGVEPVQLHERDALIDLLDAEPDPVELVAFLTSRFAPPTLTNTEGDPFVLCQATVHISDPAGMQAGLDDSYDRVDGEEPPQWVEHVTTHGMERIRATLMLDGTTLTVDTNSAQRMDRVLAALARLDPACTIAEDSRQPVRDVREAAALAEQMPKTGEGVLDPDSPEVAAALNDFIRTYETKWLDEPIPALDGHSPRQAADDPTRRGDLIKLLDTFPAGDAARGGMDADRLRTALGLG